MLGGANEYKTVASAGKGVSLGNFALTWAVRSRILINCVKYHVFFRHLQFPLQQVFLTPQKNC